MARTAVTLVSKLAVLFYTLAEDVKTFAEVAGLKWQWRKDEGGTVEDGKWEGDCKEVGFFRGCKSRARVWTERQS